MKPKTPKLLPLPAMARQLNVKPRDLRTAVAAGDVPTIRVGDSLLFNPDAVEQALLDQARESKRDNDD
jgi:hypothetical protein